VIIDMQRDFLEPGGFGAVLGNDVSLLRRTIAPTQRVLDAAHRAGLTVIHTREGHRPDLADLPPAKKVRGRPAAGIGDPGPMGRILFDQLERQQLAIVNHFKGTQLLPSPEPPRAVTLCGVRFARCKAPNARSRSPPRADTIC